MNNTIKRKAIRADYDFHVYPNAIVLIGHYPDPASASGMLHLYLAAGFGQDAASQMRNLMENLGREMET